MIATYENWRRQSISAFSTFQDGWNGIKGVGSGIESISNALEGNGNAWQTVTGVVDGFISIMEGINAIVSIVNLLTGATTAHTGAQFADAGAASAAFTAQTMETGAQEAAAVAAIPAIAANKALTTSYMELAASMIMAAHASIPFAGVPIATGYIAEAVATVLGVQAMPFAEGGVISGPTMALVGEYAGAVNNPEVIAPLDKLRSLIEPNEGFNGKVEFEIAGRKLVGVIEKEYNHRKRS